MIVDQLSELAGMLVGALVGTYLAHKLFKTSRKVALLFGLALVALTLGRAAMLIGENSREQFMVGFRKGCIAKCTAGNACSDFCDCRVKALSSHPDANKIIGRLTRTRSEANLSPEQRTQLLDIGADCIKPEVYDTRFVDTCFKKCTGAGCEAKCRCILERIREGMDPVAGTRWLVKNFEAGPATQEGQARLKQAVAACTDAMKTPH